MPTDNSVTRTTGFESKGIAVALRKGFTCRGRRVGTAQDLAKTCAEIPTFMTAGRWKSSTMPARYTERQAADRGAVAKYWQATPE